MLKKIDNQLNKRVNMLIIYISFSCFLIILLWFIIFKCNSSRVLISAATHNVPQTIRERFMYQFSINIKSKVIINDIFLNIGVFLPFCLYMPLLFKKQNIMRDILLAFLFSLLLESIQLFTGIGGFTYLDLIANTLGGIIGAFIFKILRPHTSNKTINYINFVVIIIALPISFYCIANTIINYKLYIPFFTI